MALYILQQSETLSDEICLQVYSCMQNMKNVLFHKLGHIWHHLFNSYHFNDLIR